MKYIPLALLLISSSAFSDYDCTKMIDSTIKGYTEGSKHVDSAKKIKAENLMHEISLLRKSKKDCEIYRMLPDLQKKHGLSS